MSARAGTGGYVASGADRSYSANGVSADIMADERSGSQVSERETTTVTLNLSRFHDSIEHRRPSAVQHAKSVCDVDTIPSTAVLAAGSLSVRIPFADILAATDDFSKSPLVEGVRNNGFIMLNPDTITPEGLKLLAEAFMRRKLRMGEDRAVHLLHICIQLKVEQLFVCMDEQPELFVTDSNFLALTTCLFDHDRSRGNLLQFCLHRLHSVWSKLVARCPRNLRQLLESCANAPFSDVLVDAFSLCADPNFGGCCNARGGYGMLLHLLRREHTPTQCKHFQSAVGRINNLPHKPLILLPYLFGKQLCPSGATCPHCHAALLYTLLKTKVTPTKMSVVTEIHSSTNSCVVIWKVAHFRQLTQPTYSFDFRTPQNRVLHMRIDPLGFGRGKGTHLSVFFKESQTLEEDVHFHFVLGVTSSTQDAFVKPMLNCVLSRRRREYTGRQAFMPLKTIKEGGYIEPDGSLLLMLEIVELPTNGGNAANQQAAAVEAAPAPDGGRPAGKAADA